MLVHLHLKSTPVRYEGINNMFNYEHQLKFWENQTALENPPALTEPSLPSSCHLNSVRVFKELPLAMPTTAPSTATAGQIRSNNLWHETVENPKIYTEQNMLEKMQFLMALGKGQLPVSLCPFTSDSLGVCFLLVCY